MPRPLIDLSFMPYDLMLILEYGSGVLYRHQVGGTLCMRPTLEGVLAAVNVADEDVKHIMELSYENGPLNAEIADAIDVILGARPGTRHLVVDRSRLDRSFEAWVWVHVETRVDSLEENIRDGYFGMVYDFGRISGVLVWPNSD